MVTAKNNPAPFNSSQKRFGIITVHPDLDPSGLYTVRPQGCDPCLYQPKLIQKLCEATHTNKIDKDPWRYKNELEEWAKNLGYRNQKVLDQRRWQLSLLGPAWHNVDIPKKYESPCKNLGFGRTSRTQPSKNNIAGPGTYYKAVPFKAPYGPHSKRSTLDREEPCRFKDMVPNWSLAPDRYHIKDKESIEEKSNKVVSRRGPYDLFTGKRDGSTIKNHFNMSLKCTAATWPIALKGSLEKYKTSRFGVMNKTNRDKPHRGRNTLACLAMCPREAKEPGPAHYNLAKLNDFKEYNYAFNSSYDKPRGYIRQIVWPGVGRYNLKDLSCGILGQGHKHVFLSKLGRTIGAVIPAPMNSF